MPTYEYRCTKCNRSYEKREGFDAPALQNCIHCGEEARRVLYAPPILFKSSGFYVTDNRKGGLVGSPSSPSSEVESVTSGGNGKKESKAEKSAADSKPPEAAAAS